jgi:hypothetical protein
MGKPVAVVTKDELKLIQEKEQRRMSSKVALLKMDHYGVSKINSDQGFLTIYI